MLLFQPRISIAGYGMRPFSYHQHLGRRGFMPSVAPIPIFRNRPRNNSSNGERLEEQKCEEEFQFNNELVECNKTCVCNRCGKEF